MTGLKFFSLLVLTCPGSHQAHGMSHWILIEREIVMGIIDMVM